MKINIISLISILLIGGLARAALLPSISPVSFLLYFITTSILFYTLERQQNNLLLTTIECLLFSLSPLSISLALSIPLSINLLLATIGLFLASLLINRLKLTASLFIILIIPLFFLQYFSLSINYLNPDYLFFNANWDQFNFLAPYSGYLLLPSIIFLPLGLIYAFKQPEKLDLILLFFLFSVPIFNSLTPSALIPLSHFSSLGIIQSSKLFKKSKINNLFYPLAVILLYFLSFAYFSDLLLFHAPKLTPYYLQNSL